MKSTTRRNVRAIWIRRADIYAAHQALQLKNLGLARKLLQQSRDVDPEGNLRHWEWRALWEQCQGDAESWIDHKRPVGSLRVHPDGKLVAAGGSRLCVWGVSTGSIVHEFKIHGMGVARFSPDGDLLYTLDESGSVHAWHVPSFEPADFLLSHEIPFHSEFEMQVAPDGRWLATFAGRTAGDVTIWDTRTQELKKRIPTPFWYCGLAFSPDSSKLAFGGSSTRFVDLQTMNETHFMDGGGSRMFSPDGTYIATVQEVGFIIQRVVDGEQIAQVAEHSYATNDVAYSSDGKLIASASLDQTVLLWDTESRRVIAELREHDLGVVCVAFTPDGQRLLSGGRDGKICVWNLAQIEKKAWPISKRAAQNTWDSPQVSCSPDGSVIATTHRKNGIPETENTPGVTLLSTKDLTATRTFAESSGLVRGVLYSPVENLLVIANEEGGLEFINFDESEKRHSVPVAEGKQALPVRFTPDGKRLLVVLREKDDRQEGESDKSTCELYSVPDRRLIVSWPIPKKHGAAISPNGELIVTGHDDGLRFWPLDNLQNPTHVLVGGLGGEGRVWSVDFSPDGAYVAAGADLTGRIEIVDARTKRSAGHLAGHIQHIGAVRFSPDGKRLLSGGHTSSDAMKLWDFESRREIMSLTVDGARSAGLVEWLPDGNSIMLHTGESTVSIWRAPSFDEIQKRERLQDPHR